jgi:copper transport protein
VVVGALGEEAGGADAGSVVIRRRLAAVAVLVVGLVVGAAAPASAHATLEATSPQDGTVLATAPSEVTLTFSEDVTLPDGGLRIFDDQGSRADDGRPGRGDSAKVIRIGLGGDLRPGTYLVSWRVVSADGHVINGASSFSLGSPTTPPSQLAAEVRPPSTRPWGIAGDVARAFGYAGSLLAVGGLAFLLAVTRRGDATRAERALLATAAGVAIVAAFAGVVVQTVRASGLGRRAATDTALLGDTFREGFGVSATVRMAGLAVFVLGVLLAGRADPARGKVRWAIAGVGAAATLASFPLTGHSQSTSPRALIVLADLVHLGAAAIWLGGLVFLGLAIRRRRDEDRQGRRELAEVVSRYSVMATSAVFALAAAGVLFAYKQTGSIDALTSTRYGGLLIAKVALALAVGGVGLYNNRVLVPTIEQNPGRGPVGELARTIRVEVVVLLAIVSVTAVLVSQTPAREASAAPSGPFITRLDLDATRQLDIELAPARIGSNEAHLNIYEAGLPADIAQEVTVRLRLVEQGIGPLEHEATRLAPGHWVARLDDMTIPGKWQVDVVLLVSEFDQLTATAVVPIRAA